MISLNLSTLDLADQYQIQKGQTDIQAIQTLNVSWDLSDSVFSKSDRSRDLQHRGDKSLDLLSFPMKNPIFQQSIVNISGSLKLKFKFCDVHLLLHLFPVVIFENMQRICKISCYSCIEVNDKRRVCLSSVMAKNADCFGLYRINQLRCDVMPTSRMQTNQTYLLPSGCLHVQK